MSKQLSPDIIFNILSYNDEFNTILYNNRILIFIPNYKILLKQLKQTCSVTDQSDINSWRRFNQECMKIIYKNCSYHDFHLLLKDLGTISFMNFVELETINMLHHLSLSYYKLLKYIYDTKEPILKNEDKALIYGLFWDYCKYYFMKYKGLEPRENTILL
jgi:hypothetical protein